MKLKKWLRKNEIGVRQFARRIDVNPDAVRKWLDGGPMIRSNALKIEKATEGKVKADKLPKVTRRFKGRRKSDELERKLRAV